MPALGLEMARLPQGWLEPAPDPEEGPGEVPILQIDDATWQHLLSVAPSLGAISYLPPPGPDQHWACRALGTPAGDALRAAQTHQELPADVAQCADDPVDYSDPDIDYEADTDDPDDLSQPDSSSGEASNNRRASVPPLARPQANQPAATGKPPLPASAASPASAQPVITLLRKAGSAPVNSAKAIRQGIKQAKAGANRARKAAQATPQGLPRAGSASAGARAPQASAGRAAEPVQAGSESDSDDSGAGAGAVMPVPEPSTQPAVTIARGGVHTRAALAGLTAPQQTQEPTQKATQQRPVQTSPEPLPQEPTPPLTQPQSQPQAPPQAQPQAHPQPGPHTSPQSPPHAPPHTSSHTSHHTSSHSGGESDDDGSGGVATVVPIVRRRIEVEPALPDYRAMIDLRGLRGLPLAPVRREDVLVQDQSLAAIRQQQAEAAHAQRVGQQASRAAASGPAHHSPPQRPPPARPPIPPNHTRPMSPNRPTTLTAPTTDAPTRPTQHTVQQPLPPIILSTAPVGSPHQPRIGSPNKQPHTRHGIPVPDTGRDMADTDTGAGAAPASQPARRARGAAAVLAAGAGQGEVDPVVKAVLGKLPRRTQQVLRSLNRSHDALGAGAGVGRGAHAGDGLGVLGGQGSVGALDYGDLYGEDGDMGTQDRPPAQDRPQAQDRQQAQDKPPAHNRPPTEDMPARQPHVPRVSGQTQGRVLTQAPAQSGQQGNSLLEAHVGVTEALEAGQAAQTQTVASACAVVAQPRSEGGAGHTTAGQVAVVASGVQSEAIAVRTSSLQGAVQQALPVPNQLPLPAPAAATAATAPLPLPLPTQQGPRSLPTPMPANPPASSAAAAAAASAIALPVPLPAPSQAPLPLPAPSVPTSLPLPALSTPVLFTDAMADDAAGTEDDDALWLLAEQLAAGAAAAQTDSTVAVTDAADTGVPSADIPQGAVHDGAPADLGTGTNGAGLLADDTQQPALADVGSAGQPVATGDTRLAGAPAAAAAGDTAGCDRPQRQAQQGSAQAANSLSGHKRILSIYEGADTRQGNKPTGPAAQQPQQGVEVGLYADIKAHGRQGKKQRRAKQGNGSGGGAGNGGGSKRPKYEVIEKPPCKHWRFGRCSYGSECRFAHEGQPVTTLIPCRDVQAGRACPRGDKCPFSHTLGLLEPCRGMITTGVCPNVGRCRCAHEFEPDQLDLLREYYQLLARAEAARRQQQQQTGN